MTWAEVTCRHVTRGVVEMGGCGDHVSGEVIGGVVGDDVGGATVGGERLGCACAAAHGDRQRRG